MHLAGRALRMADPAAATVTEIATISRKTTLGGHK